MVFLKKISNTNKNLDKFLILNFNNFKIDNVKSIFGIEKYNNQLRLNININKKNYNLYEDLFNDIYSNEIFFNKEYNEDKYELLSNVLDRNNYEFVIKCHLKKISDNITSLFYIKHKNILHESSWDKFDKEKNFSMIYSFDTIWKNHKTKLFGISIAIQSIIQEID